jgi:RNA polymerase sigma factor (TIGR02999 family)
MRFSDRLLVHRVRKKQADHTLNTTALIHEAYLKLLQSKSLHIKDRRHFYRLSARAMRQVLVNAAEKKQTKKRGENALHITFDEEHHLPAIEAEDILVLHEALQILERMDPRQGQIVECRFFGGLNIRETADVLGISIGTVNRDWRIARAWLTHTIRNGNQGP